MEYQLILSKVKKLAKSNNVILTPVNQLRGIVQQVRVEGNLSLVSLDVSGIELHSIVIDSPETNDLLKIGNKVTVIFKETEVIIGKGNCDHISLRNKLPGRIVSLESAKLLSRLKIDTAAGVITSVITSGAVDNLTIRENDEVVAMVKTNEIMLSA